MTPIDMVLYCPVCGVQHIDKPESRADEQERALVYDWTNPPHRSHLCHGCGHIWRPADVPTNGVQAVKTKGKADSPVRSVSHPYFEALVKHALGRGLITVHSELMVDRDFGTRCSWLQGHDKACDISNEAAQFLSSIPKGPK